jgi:hypothetical protein
MCLRLRHILKQSFHPHAILSTSISKKEKWVGSVERRKELCQMADFGISGGEISSSSFTNDAIRKIYQDFLPLRQTDTMMKRTDVKKNKTCEAQLKRNSRFKQCYCGRQERFMYRTEHKVFLSVILLKY